jgi:integral membrane protein (TIGR00529 family)
MLNLIGVIVAFIIVIFLIRRRINFGLSLIIGSIILGFFSLQEIQLIDILKAIIEASFFSFKSNSIITGTIELALLLFLIYLLAKAMQESGAIQKLIYSLRTLFSKGGTLGAIPAVYGLMPVPGGALFSAPMIDEEGDKYKLNKDQKNFLNIWFRHIWFLIYPISAAMILLSSSQMFDINIYHLVGVQIPAFILMILIGIFSIKKFSSKYIIKNKQKEKKNYSGLIYLLPPLIPLPLSFLFMPFGLTQVQSFLIGVLISIPLVLLLSKTPKEEYFGIIKKGLSWKLPLAIFGIMIFREMFMVSKIDVFLGNIVQDIPIHPIIFFIIIPLFFGIVMGYNLGAIGVSFPIIYSFIPLFNEVNFVALASIMYVSSLVGYLISPLHLCNVVSSEFLKVDVTGMYKILIPASIALLIANTIVMLFIL